MTRILIVDDDPVQLRLTANVAEKGGFDAVIAQDGETALNLLEQDKGIGAMVLDLVMPDLDGMGVMARMRELSIDCPVIVQTAHSSLETVIEAMRSGAFDFFVKPVAPERLIISLRNALKLTELETVVRHDRHRRSGRVRISDIVSESAVMRRVFELAAKAAKSTIPVLIEGESGVGKEIVARAIQGSSDRAGKPFVTVNCGALPRELVESTLFGHVKGAFTGAISDQTGKFEEADGGTLFLDEIGELPLDAQVKLLRAIQEGEIEPVGSNAPKKVNVRIISATNRRLLNMTLEGRFREDLYYRLNVFPVYVPPLRDRRDDILPLANYFLTRLSAESARRVVRIGDDAVRLLKDYEWPGNVRQLENVIYRATVLADGTELIPADFPQIHADLHGTGDLRTRMAETHTSNGPRHIDAPAIADEDEQDAAWADMDRFDAEDGSVRSLADVERDLIAYAIERNRGQMSAVARQLGIGRSTLYRKLKEYGLDSREARLARPDAA